MIRIAIVDDEEIITKTLQNRIESILNSSGTESEIQIFLDGKSLLNKCAECGFDLIFLDIDMPEITGIDIAQKIRLKEEKTEIIFVTNKDEFVYEAIKYTPFRFIRKNRFDDEIKEALSNYLNKVSKKNVLKTFSTENGKKSVSIARIVYIEVRSHKLIVNMNDAKESFTANGNLKDVEAELVSYGFIKIHQSYIVNFRYINAIKQKELILDNGCTLPLSRGKYQNTQMDFIRFSKEM